MKPETPTPTPIPTPTPEMLETLLKLLPEIANYLECCVESNRHDPDDSVHLLEALQPFL